MHVNLVNVKLLFRQLLFRKLNAILPSSVPVPRLFTALHRMQMRSRDENSVCLSVCLSNVQIVTKQKKNLSKFLYYTKDHSAEFSEEQSG